MSFWCLENTMAGALPVPTAVESLKQSPKKKRAMIPWWENHWWREAFRRLGSGALGVVYEGVQASLGRRVAVKMLSNKAAKMAFR